jgi:hypothetical protein
MRTPRSRASISTPSVWCRGGPKDRRNASLHLLLVHVVTETNRHVGHADIVRELLDGAVGHRPGVDNLPSVDDGWWAEHRVRLEAVAREVAGLDRTGSP